MNLLQIGVAATVVAGGLLAFLAAWRLALWTRRRRAGLAGSSERAQPVRGAPETRLARIERVQAELATRLDELAAHAPEERLQAMAGSLSHLIRDKNATLETALAGLDTLRARLRALEQMGDLAETRGLFERLGTRIDELQAGTEARLAGLDARAEAERSTPAIAEQLTRLHAQKDTVLETTLARLAPLEAALARLTSLEPRLAAVEGAATGPALARLTTDFAELRAAQAAVAAGLAELRLGAETAAGAAAVAAAGREAGAQAALDRLAERLEAVQGRLAALETAENPFAPVSEQLTRLYAQKDATVETVFARLGEIEAGLAARDPQAVLERLTERLEAVQGRLAALETAENPFAEISGQLTRLYAQKDATVETVFARLGEIEAGLAARDPQAVLERLTERLEAVQGRLAALETAENPFAPVSEQLTRLYAQKDATVETVFARLAPLETRLGEIEAGLAPLVAADADPRPVLDALQARLETLHWGQGETAAGLAALQTALGDGAAITQPLAEIADQLTRLYAQKDRGVEAALARLAPLEQRLAALEARPWDPDENEARAEAQAIAAQLIAARAAAEQTDLFASRLTLLEASLPRLSQAQALMAAALDRRVARQEAAVELPVAPEIHPEIHPETHERSGAGLGRGGSRRRRAAGASGSGRPGCGVRGGSRRDLALAAGGLAAPRLRPGSRCGNPGLTNSSDVNRVRVVPGRTRPTRGFDVDSPSTSSDAAPAVLIDLIAAGLVSHEMIGDPARIGSEAAALRALCDRVAGPVYRLDPFHYAFRAAPGDLDGRFAMMPPEGWAEALALALAADLGADAAWISATDLVPTGSARTEPGPDPDAALRAPLALLRARAEAIETGLRAAEPGLQAVIDAAYAVDCARLTAAADPGAALDARLAALEAHVTARLEALTAPAALLATLSEMLAGVLQRLDAQAGVLHTHIAREEGLGVRLQALEAHADAFEERLGLGLAEFLARIEQAGAVAPARGLAAAPQLS